MFGDVLAEDVVEQMDRREQEVLIPAGLRMFVALVEGRVAGFTNLLSLRAVGYLDTVVTLPQFRRRGVATAAVTHAVGESLAGGDRLVHLLADEGEPPQALYERLGFRVRARVRSVNRSLLPGDR